MKPRYNGKANKGKRYSTGSERTTAKYFKTTLEMSEKIKRYCEKNNISQSLFIENCIDNFLSKK